MVTAWGIIVSMKIKFTKLHPDTVMPEYQTDHAAAMDIHAAINEPMVLESLDRTVVPAGFAMALPEGYEAQIRARSGLSLKHGIAMANGIGTIDADYRGQIGVIVINLSKERFVIEPGMRIAQMVIAKHERIEWEEVDQLDETQRGSGGYGSTGR